MLGYRYSISDINDYIKEITNEYIVNPEKIEVDKEQINDDIVKYILRERNETIKNLIYKFQRILNRILNNIEVKKKEQPKDTTYKKDMSKFNKDDDTYFTSQFDDIVEKYRLKLKSINITNENGSHLVFKHWKGIQNILTTDTSNTNIRIKGSHIDFNYLNEFDTNGNTLLFYFINELTNLIKFNNEKSVKVALGLMLIEFINVQHSLLNQDIFKMDTVYRKFNYFIHSVNYVEGIKDKIGETEGIYEEYVDEESKSKERTQEEQDKIDDEKEEQDALDVEGDELDYASLYDRTYDFELDVIDRVYKELGI